MATCRPSWQERLSAWFDGELSPLESALLEGHLKDCALCDAELERYGALRSAMRTGEETPISSSLTAKLRSLAVRPAEASRVRRWNGAVAASMIAVAILWGLWPAGMNEALAADLEGHHLKSFSRTSPCDFESSDPRAVEDWIRREFGWSVSVPEIGDATLLGARRCRLHGETTPAVLYRHGEKALTLFFPTSDSRAAKGAAAFADGGPRCTAGPHGERICVSSEGDRTVVAVSELDASVLVAALEALPD